MEVAEGVAEIRGLAKSEEAKGAAGEVASEVEGVDEVLDLVEVRRVI